MTTQDGYDWPTPHPVAPDYIAVVGEDGFLVIVSDKSVEWIDSGMSFQGIPLAFERRFVE
jgi:hypothetical protein